MNNPIQMFKMMLGNGSPKDMAMNLIKQNNNPIFNNLIEMANKGDTKGLEQFARNIFKEQGKNFDTAFNNFMNNFK